MHGVTMKFIFYVFTNNKICRHLSKIFRIILMKVSTFHVRNSKLTYK